MNAGDLNTRITIQQQQTVQDGAGQAIKTWVDVASVWADIRHQSGMRAGMQAQVNDAQKSTVRASARIRYRSGLDHGMRVITPVGIYTVEAILPDLRSRAYVDLVLERMT